PFAERPGYLKPSTQAFALPVALLHRPWVVASRGWAFAWSRDDPFDASRPLLWRRAVAAKPVRTGAMRQPSNRRPVPSHASSCCTSPTGQTESAGPMFPADSSSVSAKRAASAVMAVFELGALGRCVRPAFVPAVLEPVVDVAPPVVARVVPVPRRRVIVLE